MLVVWVYVALASYNTGYLTLEMRRVGCLVDEAANIAVVDGRGRIVRSERFKSAAAVEERKGRGRKESQKEGEEEKELDWRTLWNEGTDAVMDVPVGGVCEVLYGLGREDEDMAL